LKAETRKIDLEFGQKQKDLTRSFARKPTRNGATYDPDLPKNFCQGHLSDQAAEMEIKEANEMCQRVLTLADDYTKWRYADVSGVRTRGGSDPSAPYSGRGWVRNVFIPNILQGNEPTEGKVLATDFTEIGQGSKNLAFMLEHPDQLDYKNVINALVTVLNYNRILGPVLEKKAGISGRYDANTAFFNPWLSHTTILRADDPRIDLCPLGKDKAAEPKRSAKESFRAADPKNSEAWGGRDRYSLAKMGGIVQKLMDKLVSQTTPKGDENKFEAVDINASGISFAAMKDLQQNWIAVKDREASCGKWQKVGEQGKESYMDRYVGGHFQALVCIAAQFSSGNEAKVMEVVKAGTEKILNAAGGSLSTAADEVINYSAASYAAARGAMKDTYVSLPKRVAKYREESKGAKLAPLVANLILSDEVFTG
jgi:hypothetical protein